MSGTKLGGLKAAAKNKQLYGESFYKTIGRKGGQQNHPETRYFHINRQAAREAAKKGGIVSRRGKAKTPTIGSSVVYINLLRSK